MPLNEVAITITDGALGNASVPPAATMAIVGCGSAGTTNVVTSTANKTTVVTASGYGPTTELACAVIDAGGTVLLVRTPTVTAGAAVKKAAVTSVTSSGATPDVFSKTAHGFAVGDMVVGSSFTTDTAANTTFLITAADANTFTAGALAGSGSGGTTGVVTPTGLNFQGTGTSLVTFTGAPYDDLQVAVKVTRGGTIGTGPITLQLSGDAGRTYGPSIALGTANTYAIPQTGITLAFAAGTLVTADSFSLATTAPLWSDAGVSAAITALQNSPYSWGAGIFIVGNSAGADATAIEGYLDTLATGYVYTFSWLTARDYKASDATESAWMTSILSDYSATSCVRVISGGGHYNMPSSVPNQVLGGLPRYRRPGAWAAACRAVALASPQTLISRVSDGPLGKIVVNPSVDPTDGSIYHDERVNPGLGSSAGQTGRFLCMRTRKGYGGAFFVDEPWMLAPAGSDFNLLPYRQVMDVGATLTHQTLQAVINSNVRLNPNGTIVEKDARTFESIGSNTYNSNMTSTGMISSATFILSRTDNIASTKIVNATGRFVALGYVLEVDCNLGFQSPQASVGS